MLKLDRSGWMDCSRFLTDTRSRHATVARLIEDSIEFENWTMRIMSAWR